VFLQTIEHGRSFDPLKKKDVTTLVGKFCSFLLHDTVSWQTSINYLSSMERQLETTTRTDLFKREAEWYKRCRRNLHQQFVLQAIKSGKRLEDQAAMMTLEDLEEMSKALLLQNRTVALMDRTLLNNQWLSIGRSSDIGNLLFDDLHWLDHFLVIDVTRYDLIALAPRKCETLTLIDVCRLNVRQQHFRSSARLENGQSIHSVPSPLAPGRSLQRFTKSALTNHGQQK
jgi:hypothetical protein